MPTSLRQSLGPPNSLLPTRSRVAERHPSLWEPPSSLRLCLEPQSSLRPAWSHRDPSLTVLNSRASLVPAWRLRAPSISAWSRRVCLSRIGDILRSLEAPSSHRLSLELLSSLRPSQMPQNCLHRSLMMWSSNSSLRPSLELSISLRPSHEADERNGLNYNYSYKYEMKDLFVSYEGLVPSCAKKTQNFAPAAQWQPP